MPVKKKIEAVGVAFHSYIEKNQFIEFRWSPKFGYIITILDSQDKDYDYPAVYIIKNAYQLFDMLVDEIVTEVANEENDMYPYQVLQKTLQVLQPYFVQFPEFADAQKEKVYDFYGMIYR